MHRFAGQIRTRCGHPDLCVSASSAAGERISGTLINSKPRKEHGKRNRKNYLSRCFRRNRRRDRNLSFDCAVSQENQGDRRTKRSRPSPDRRSGNHIADLETTISDLKNNELSELKNEVKSHLEKDRSQEILAILNHLTGNINTLGTKIDRSLETNAAQNEKLKAHDLYLENLNKLFVDKWK